VNVSFTYKKVTDGIGAFAKVDIVFKPTKPREVSSFESKIVDGAIPESYVAVIGNTIISALETERFSGFPIHINASLMDGAYHETDSSPFAFEIASLMAFRDALSKGDKTLLEPIMKIEITTPVEYVGIVFDDMSSRRGDIYDATMRENPVKVLALVPFANLLGYANHLTSVTKGSASLTMRFDHFAPVGNLTGDDDNFPSASAMRIRAA
jgi:elongation factor G